MCPRIKFIAPDQVSFYCPGCQRTHSVKIGTGPGPRWTYNNNPVSPTFTPSVLCTWSEPSDSHFDDPAYDIEKRCHSFVTNGEIQYLNDSTHILAGKTIPLPVIEGPSDVT